MHITDPSLWPAGLGPLRFERSGDAPRAPIAVRGADGDAVARLTPLDGLAALDGADGAVLPLTGAWTLTLGATGEDHVLMCAPDAARDGGALEAWATLAVLWALTPTRCPRGQS